LEFADVDNLQAVALRMPRDVAADTWMRFISS
jgi:hypothetical protein